MPPVVPRLAGEHNFRNVYRRGRRFRGACLLISYLRTKAEPTRIAVVVSRKVSTLATKRNLYKRRLWGCLRGCRQTIPPYYQIIVTAQPNIKDFNYQELSEQVNKLVEKIR